MSITIFMTESTDGIIERVRYFNAKGKMMTAEQVAKIVAKGIAKRKRLCLMEIEGRATHFVKKFAPAFLDKMFYLVMSREPDSPFK